MSNLSAQELEQLIFKIDLMLSNDTAKLFTTKESE